MADEAEQAAPERGKKNLVVLAAAVVVAIGAGVGGTLFFLGSDEESVAVEQPKATSNKPATAVYHNMRPPYIINYLTGNKPRYLQAEISIMARDEGVIEATITHMPLIRSQIVSYLTEQNFLDLQTQEGKEAVRAGIVDVVNTTLADHDVVPGIESALLTNFVLQ